MTTIPEPTPAAAIETSPRRVPAWVTDPGLIADILAGHADIDDDLVGEA